ncbi:MAG: YihY/virulence factor BrkB family protein [Bacteroidota bacterium]
MSTKPNLRKRQILHRHLRYSNWYIKLISILKRIRLRHGKASLYRIFIIFLDKTIDNQIFEKAYGVAFNFTLAVFPSVIFLFALIPFIHTWIPSISQQEILNFMSEIMPTSLYQASEQTIRNTVEIRREGLISFGVLFALFLATNGVNSLMKAFNASYKTNEKRSFIKMRFIALVLTIILAFTFILAIVLLLVGNFVINWMFSFGLLAEGFDYFFIIFLRFLVIFICFYLVISCFYYWGPAIHDKWRFFSIGSGGATLACVIVSFGFTLYLSNFATYNKVYGSIGTLIAFMIWQYLMSAILLLGFEFNASMDRAANGEVYELEREE